MKHLTGFLALFLFASHAWTNEWVALVDKKRNELEARIVAVNEESVTVIRRKDNKQFEIPLERLSTKSESLVLDWKKNQAEGPAGGLGIPQDLPKRLYPLTPEELDEGLREIMARKGSSGIEADQVEALNKLNAYRFLCGTSSNVKLSRQKITEAKDAANACQEAGKTSHDLGRSTDKCNLHTGQSTIPRAVSGWIHDPGGSNRNDRAHRRWCLNHRMGEVGFGESENGRYYAMWATDESARPNKGSWSYPGPGLFPLEYLHGNSWSLYLTENAPAAGSLAVEVYQLDFRPERPYSASAEIPGKKLPVPFVGTFLNVINFEPTGQSITSPGIYYVRIRGGGVREQYLVELIDR